MFCKPKQFSTKTRKIPNIFCFVPANPVFAGVFPIFFVDKPVENVENSLENSRKIPYIFHFMLTDVLSCNVSFSALFMIK